MSLPDNGRKLNSLDYGGALDEPVNARFYTTSTYKSNQPGTVVTDECLVIEKVEHGFEFEFQGLQTPPTPGDKNDASAEWETFNNSVGGGGGGGGGLSVTCPDCMFGDTEIKGGSDTATQTIKGRYTGTSLQPISVGS